MSGAPRLTKLIAAERHGMNATFARLLKIEKRIRAAGAAPRRTTPGSIYVVSFDRDVIKVGRSVCPKRRVQDHSVKSSVHGSETLGTWISSPHDSFERSETELIRWCRRNGDRAKGGREYFTGIPFTFAVAAGKVITAASELGEALGEDDLDDRFVAELVEADRRRAARLQELTDAVGGDLSSTYADAAEALAGQAGVA